MAARDNPFYIQPATPDITPVLTGLGNLAQQAREDRKKAVAQKSLTDAIKSNDPMKMAEVSVQYPEYANAIKNAFGFTNKNSERLARETYRRVLADPENAVQYMQQGIELVNQAGGRPDMMTKDLQMLQESPEQAIQAIKMGYAGIDPAGYKAAFGGKSGAEDTAGIRDFEYYQNLKKTDPESAKAFGRERGFISSEGQELSSHLQKRLSAATDEAIKSERNASQYTTLAGDIQGADIGGGVLQGRWSEYMKDVTGNQDAVTNLRQAYMGIRSSQAVKNLPPGVASDKDIELALKGFPTENANGDQIASFLRGMAKLEKFNADFNTFKSEYISDKGTERNMLSNWKGIMELPDGVTEEDIQVTMEENDMSRYEVMKKLKGM